MTHQEVAEAEGTVDAITPAKPVPYAAAAFASDKPRLISINPERTELWVSQQPATYSTLAIDKLTMDDVKELASGPIIGHDLKTTFRALLAHELTWPGGIGHDTRIGAFLLNSLERSRELSDLLGQNIDTDDGGIVVGSIWKLYEDQRAQFEKLPKIAKLARDIEFPSIYMIAKVEHRGILLDSDYLGRMSEEFAQKIKVLERNIYAHAGKEFNIGSPPQRAVEILGQNIKTDGSLGRPFFISECFLATSRSGTPRTTADSSCSHVENIDSWSQFHLRGP